MTGTRGGNKGDRLDRAFGGVVAVTEAVEVGVGLEGVEGFRDSEVVPFVAEPDEMYCCDDAITGLI